jgi:hypothetical protein
MPKILPDGWELPAVLRARVGTSIGRQRAMFHEGHALLLLHQPPRGGERERRGTVLWRSPDGRWSGAPGPSGSAALRVHVDAYQARLDELDRALGKARTARQRFVLLREARPFARAARNLHAVLQDARTAIPSDLDVLAMRDRAYDLERESSALLEEASAALQLGLAEDGEAEARASARIATETHRLNLLAAVCLPITAIGAMLGMNVQTGIEHLPGPWLFFGILGTMFGIGLGLHAWIRREPSEERERTAKVGAPAASALRTSRSP